MIRQKVISLLAATGIFLLTPLPVWAATLALSPSSSTFNRSCSFTLDIQLDTGGVQTDGTDAIVLYDTSRLSATSITPGTIYADYPGNNIDDTAGKVTVSGLASVSSAFSGVGVLAKVNFTVKENSPTGVTQVKFDFDPNDKTKTTDSNVVKRGDVQDVLSSVTNGSYTIGTGSCGTTTAGQGATGGSSTVASGSAEVKQPVKTLDQAVGGKTGGNGELTFTLAIIGSVLTVLGILGLALL